MAIAFESPPLTDKSLAGLLARLGNVPPERIRIVPPLGLATEKDVTELDDHADRLCELVDGVLVEKTVGYIESMLAVAIAGFLRDFVRPRNLGIVLGEGGTLRILTVQVRIPDACFISWQRFPGGKLLPEPIPALAPDLAVEVLSKSNTEGEMQRKLRDYFDADVRLVWYIDPETRTAMVYTAADAGVALGEDASLSGGDVLPGFQLPLRDLFAEIDKRPPSH